MQIDIPLTESWYELNQRLFETLKGDVSYSTAVYKGLGHGLYEITQGVMNQLPTKQQIGVPKEQSAFFAPIVKSFLQNSYEVIEFDPKSDESQWSELFSRETLFVLFSEDHAITAEKYPWEKLNEWLTQNKIFSIRLSHALHHFQTQEKLAKHEIRLCSLGTDKAYAFQGARFRSPGLVSPQMHWTREWEEQFFSTLNEERVEKKQAILDFENQESKTFTPYFSKETPRIYDRATLFWRDMDGSAFIQLLARELNLPITAPGEKNLLETTSPCRWGMTKGMHWLTSTTSEDLEMWRGLIAIDTTLIERPDFTEKLETTRKKLIQLQKGQ